MAQLPLIRITPAATGMSDNTKATLLTFVSRSVSVPLPNFIANIGILHTKSMDSSTAATGANHWLANMSLSNG